MFGLVLIINNKPHHFNIIIYSLGLLVVWCEDQIINFLKKH